MNDKNISEWLWMVSCIGCGRSRIWDVLSCFGSVREAYERLQNPEVRKEFFTETERKNAEKSTDEDMKKLISYCETKNICIMTYDDELYPKRLKSIHNPPAVLFCRGDMECLKNDFCISVVGTRRPSDYSARVTSALVKGISRMGMYVVSGFAVGIDIIAGMSAIDSGGKTIAVLGCGLDYDYPKENAKYRSAIEKDGLFISEYFPKSGGSYMTFPLRNRIIAALSLGTIVTEAAEKSGALITAGLASRQGKSLFTVAPHDLFDVRYGGNVKLVRDGAICLCGVKDIEYEYYENYRHKIKDKKSDGMDDIIEDEFSECKKTKPRRKSVKAAIAEIADIAEPKIRKPAYDITQLSEEAAMVYSIVKNSEKPLLADEISVMSGMDISEVLMLLTDLEIDGAVSAEAGNMYTAR